MPLCAKLVFANWNKTQVWWKKPREVGITGRGISHSHTAQWFPAVTVPWHAHTGGSARWSLSQPLSAWLPAAPRAPYTQIACTTEHSTMLVNARLCSLIFGDLNLHSYFSTVSCNGISTESRAKHETSSPLETLEASDHICSATGNPVALRTPFQTSAGRVQQGQTWTIQLCFCGNGLSESQAALLMSVK